jgi:integrase
MLRMKSSPAVPREMLISSRSNRTARVQSATNRGDGRPTNPDVVSRRFVRLTHRAGVRLRLHDLRHAYASRLIAAGVNPLTISRMLGHSSFAFTASVYGHLRPRSASSYTMGVIRLFLRN